MKYLLIISLLTFLGCQGSTLNITSEELKNAVVSDEYLKEGIVKKFRYITKGDTSVVYDKVTRKGNIVYQNRYDAEFLLLEKSETEINEDSWTKRKTIQIGIDDKEYKMDMLKPSIFSFDPDDIEQETVTQLKPGSGYVFKNEELTTLLGKDEFKFEGKQIPCIKYKTEYVYTVFEENTSIIRQEKRGKGYSLYGKDIGLIYSEVKQDLIDLTFELIEIMPINKLNEMKEKEK